MRRALVSGASGFVGANLVRALLRDGHEVHTLLRPGYRGWRLAGISGDFCAHEADIQDRDQVRRVVQETRPDWVFHLAAYGGYASQTGIDRMMAVNFAGCVHLLDACVESGAEVFVSTGSSSEYGYQDHPAVESELLQPNSHYAITKAAATHYCQLTARTAGIRAVTARLYSIFGPYEEPTRLIPTLLVDGLEGRLPPLVSRGVARDFVYVDDAVEALLTIAKSAGRIPAGSVYNVCSGRQTTIEEVVGVTRAMLGVEVQPAWSTMPDRRWDSNVWVGDPGAIVRDLGWSTKVDLASGLKSTSDWLRNHEDLLKFYRRGEPAG